MLDLLAAGGLTVFTIVSRMAYIPGGIMGFDGPDYINALKFDGTYSVPPPGNIGYVAIGWAFSLVLHDPVRAFAATAILFSVIGAVFTYLFAKLVLSRGPALAVALATITSAMAWYHGVIMQSYIVWLAALPTVGYYGLRLVRERTRGMVVGAALATGLFTIVRPDLVVFAGPLLGACLLLSRARPAWWVLAGAICAACCAVWFFSTAMVLGSVDRYLTLVRTKHEWHESFSASSRGLVEGFMRNTVKYAQFMLWSAHLALPLAAAGLLVYIAKARPHWRAWLIGAAWAGPSLYFALGIFMGNAGLILPALPLVYIAAAAGAQALFRSAGAATVVMGMIAALNTLQFTLAPIPHARNQREVLLAHMFLGYSGTGIARMYTFQLADFGITDKSLKNTLKQFRDPDPVPVYPPDYDVRIGPR